MNQKELKELIEFLIEKDIAEFELERGDVKVRVKRAAEPAAQAPADRIITVHPAPLAVSTPLQAAASAEAASAAPPPPAKVEKTSHGAFTDRGNLLRIAIAGLASIREAGRSGRSRAGALHRRSHEVDE